MYIQRNIEEKILKKYLKAPEVVALIGPRQCGKTTMIQHILKNVKNKVMLSFDKQEDRQMFEENPDDFANSYIKKGYILFIDEFHHAKKGGEVLKYLYDTYNKPKIIISGSSSIDLTIKAVKHLVGRVFILNLYPFDFLEFLRAKDKTIVSVYKKYKLNKAAIFDKVIHKKFVRYYEEYLLYGGYPRVVLEKDKEIKKQILQDIYNTYFLREVKDILGLIDDYKLNNLIKALSLQIGSLLDYEELGQISGFNFKTLKKYINFLEKTYICRLVRPLFKNKRIEIVKNPILYFVDTGMRNLIAKDFRKLNERTDSGFLLENGLASQFIKKQVEFNFWRDKNKNEIDFVLLLENKRMVAIESKLRLRDVNLSGKNVFQKLYPKSEFYRASLLVGKKTDNQGDKIVPAYLF